MRLMLGGMVLVIVLLPRLCEAGPRWRFAVVRDGEVAGRMDIMLARRDGKIFMVSAFYPGREAVAQRAKKTKPSRRSYAELLEPGFLGKFKRWEIVGRLEHYWILFSLDGTLRVRHEKGLGGKANVRELGKEASVVPLDVKQPFLAWLLVASGPSARTSQCASPAPGTMGVARLTPEGNEEVDTRDGQRRTARRFDVSGDCGTFTIWLDEQGDPLVIEAGGERFERL